MNDLVTRVAVIGAGHAGIEAALASARLGCKTVMFTVTLENKRNLVGRINECEECIKVSIPPKKDENTPKKACNYCNYKKQCQKDG